MLDSLMWLLGCAPLLSGLALLLVDIRRSRRKPKSLD